ELPWRAVGGSCAAAAIYNAASETVGYRDRAARPPLHVRTVRMRPRRASDYSRPTYLASVGRITPYLATNGGSCCAHRGKSRTRAQLARKCGDTRKRRDPVFCLNMLPIESCCPKGHCKIYKDRLT